MSAFATANIDLASVDGGVGKVLSLCALHGMNGDEILNAWDAFQCNHPEVDSLSLQALDVMAAELQTRADRTMFKPAAQAQPVEFDISNISSMYVYLAVWWRRSRGEEGRGEGAKKKGGCRIYPPIRPPSSFFIHTSLPLSFSLSLCSFVIGCLSTFSLTKCHAVPPSKPHPQPHHTHTSLSPFFVKAPNLLNAVCVSLSFLNVERKR